MNEYGYILVRIQNFKGNDKINSFQREEVSYLQEIRSRLASQFLSKILYITHTVKHEGKMKQFSGMQGLRKFSF